MPRDRSDAIIVRYQPLGEAAHRDVYEPNHTRGDYDRIREVYTGDGWEAVGHQVVRDVEVEHPDLED